MSQRGAQARTQVAMHVHHQSAAYSCMHTCRETEPHDPPTPNQGLGNTRDAAALGVSSPSAGCGVNGVAQ